MVSYFMFRKEIATPALLFSLGMCVCAINLLNFVSIWDVNIHENTFQLVVGGCLFMTIGAFFSDKVNYRLKAVVMPQEEKLFLVSIRSLKFILVYLLTVSFLQIYFINQHYGTGNLAANLYLHTEMMKLGDDKNLMQLPRLVSYIFSTPTTTGYVLAFLLPVYICKSNEDRKLKLLILIDFIICLCSSLLDGGRTHMLHIIITCGIFYLMVRWYYRKHLNLKIISIWFFMAFVFLAGFQ